MEYRDQLSAFDRTIQEYQDVLNGKAELPQQMKMEDVSMLLERTRAARERAYFAGKCRFEKKYSQNLIYSSCLSAIYPHSCTAGQDVGRVFPSPSWGPVGVSEMPNELLEIYLNQYKVAANLSHQNEAALMEYRLRLAATLYWFK